MHPEEFKTMTEVSQTLNSILQDLSSRKILEAERRKLDDARDESARKDRKELLDRVNAHGTRTTALETKWAAFFGDEGAFKLVMKAGAEQSKKLDRNTWLIAIGFGILIATEFFLKR